jgi:hypothetical protein
MTVTLKSRIGALAMPTLLGCAGLFALWQARQIASVGGYSPVGPGFFPTVIGALLLLLAPLLAWTAWRELESSVPSGPNSRTNATDAAKPELPPTTRANAHQAFGWIAAAVAAGALGIERAGYIPAMTMAFVLAAQAFPAHAARRLSADVIVALLVSMSTWFAFTLGLGLRLPGGWLSFLPGA